MKIEIELSSQSIDKAIEKMYLYEEWVVNRRKEFIRRLAEVGVDFASVSFQNAQYDGKNDVTVSMEVVDDRKVKIVASGVATFFIEFGTGITYPDSHPMKPEGVLGRGEYGKGMGKFSSWEYYGEPGTNGRIVGESDKGTLIKTQGNPANMCMYNTYKELLDRIYSIAAEVFSK